jgi:hypothetical protein
MVQPDYSHGVTSAEVFDLLTLRPHLRSAKSRGLFDRMSLSGPIGAAQ